MSDCTNGLPKEWGWVQISPHLLTPTASVVSPLVKPDMALHDKALKCYLNLYIMCNDIFWQMHECIHILYPYSTVSLTNPRYLLLYTPHESRLGTFFVTRPLPSLNLHPFLLRSPLSLPLSIFLSRYNCCRICTTGIVSSLRIKGKWISNLIKRPLWRAMHHLGSWF